MLFMVIEHFRDADAPAIYRRLEERGRQLPEGLTYVSSWISADLGRCFQVMDCADVTLLQQWVAAWRDLARFEIVPVAESAATRRAITGKGPG